MNDVGILSGILYGNNIRAVLDDENSINLGSVYECVVASEVKSGKDYTVHSALNTFVNNEDYHIKKAYVVSNASTKIYGY